MTPCPHTISRAYIAGNIPARPLPRGAIDLAGLDFGQEETEDEPQFSSWWLVCIGLSVVLFAIWGLQL